MFRKELITFLVVGCLTVLVDYATYRSLTGLGLLGINPAKGVSFLTGTAFAYFANRFWTFGNRAHAPGGMLRFAMLYALTLLLNVGANALVIHVLASMLDRAYTVQLAFLVATGLSAVLNFLGMKYFVFIPTPRQLSP